VITERDRQAIRVSINLVEDPEVPITLNDLGVVRGIQFGDNEVTVTLRPTRLACPAREEMARRIRVAIADAAPVENIEIRWEMAAWQGADVSAAGTQVLLDIGYAHPHLARQSCPFCGADDVRAEGDYGGSVCKRPYTCRACGSTFDALKSASPR
jgi:ring-1,2-phenylacetyl-CoA epoxidase subunit PaaD